MSIEEKTITEKFCEKWAAEEGWPEELPELAAETPEPPDFPLDSLPPVLRDMAAGVAETTQTSPAMAGTMALACLAAAVAGKFEIEPKPDYREPLNLYTLIAADPAERKSATLALMTAPLYRFQSEENARRAFDIQAYEDQREALETELAKIKRDKKPDKAERMADKRREMDALPVVEPVCIIADDVTPEVTASLLAENHGILSIFSAEGGIFGNLAGRYSNGQPNLSTFLKAHSGDPSLILATVDEYARKHDIDRPEHPTAESKHLALDNLLRHVAADIRSGNTPESEFDYVGDSDYIGSVLDGLGVNL